MSSNPIYKLISLLVLLSLAIQPTTPALARELQPASAPAPAALDLAPADGVLFRTTVTLRNATDRARLEALGVVVLARHGGNGYTEAPPGMGASAASVTESVSVLADAEQLAALARLRFEPRASDAADALIASHARAKPWLTMAS